MLYLAATFLRVRLRVHGEKVVVLGGGTSGAQIADFLSQRGYDVTIVTAGKEIAKDSAVVVRALLLDRLQQCGVTMLTDTRIVGIMKGKVLIVGPGDSEELPGELSADTVVASTGARPNYSLADDLRKFVKQVFVVGDAVEPRDVDLRNVRGSTRRTVLTASLNCGSMRLKHEAEAFYYLGVKKSQRFLTHRDEYYFLLILDFFVRRHFPHEIFHRLSFFQKQPSVPLLFLDR